MWSEDVWKEVGRAEISDVQLLLSRFVKERCAESVNESVDLLERTLAALRRATVEPLTFVQVGDFMENVGEPPPMFADDLLPDKQLILWSGRAKVGKSLAAYQMMEDVALGNPVFGHFKLNKPGPVLYIGMEDGKHEINRRLRSRGLDPDDKEIAIYVNTDHRDYGLPENVDALRAFVETMPEPPTLIVLDTITESFDCVREWNDRNSIKRAFRALRTFAQDFCTVLGIIHNVKGNAEERESGDEIAGSLAVVSSCDGYLSCYKRRLLPSGNLQLFVRGGGRGGISPQEFIIEMNTETYHWRWLDSEEMEQAKRAEQNALKQKQWEKVERAVSAKDNEATVQEIASVLSMSEAYVRTLVKDMVTANRLIKTNKTKSSGAGKPAPVYGLTGSNNNNETIDSSIEHRYYSDAEETNKTDPLSDFFEETTKPASDEEENWQ